jgi:hypothetical protein
MIVTEPHSDVIVTFGVERGTLIALIAVSVAVIVAIIFFARRRQRK